MGVICTLPGQILCLRKQFRSVCIARYQNERKVQDDPYYLPSEKEVQYGEPKNNICPIFR